MRILVAVERLDPVGGAERSVLEEAERLAQRGHEFVVTYRSPGSFIARWKDLGADLVASPLVTSPRHPERALVGAWRSARLVRDKQIDVVYCNFFATLPFSILVRRLLGVPVVMAVREPVAGRIRGPFYRAMLRRVDGFRFVSAAQRAAYERAGWVRPGGAVIANGVDPGVYRPPDEAERAAARRDAGASEDTILVLYLGRLDPTKGIETLLEAVPLLGDPRIAVRVVGGVSPWLRRPERYAGRLAAQAPAGVRFVGRTDDPRRSLWAADVVVIPSLWEEPLSRVALEAMASGVPVVASRTGGLPEVLGDELSALLFEPGHAGQLVEALRSAVPQLGAGRDWAAAGRKRVVDHFGLERTTTRLEALLVTTAQPVVEEPGAAQAN
jgi:glycosyltransferase involved in cell wall biosynthesis